MTEINRDQIKLMQSQNLDDTDEGGGEKTVHEVVDGNVNNLFPDISRLDRTYGRVSLRKAFLSVNTDDRSVYYGSHIAITEQASDPLVNVTFFTTEDWFDMRPAAINAIEQYLAVGPQYIGMLYGQHYKGSRLLCIICETDGAEFDINDVFCLHDKDETEYEFCRATKVEISIITGTDAEGKKYTKKKQDIQLSAPLKRDYEGEEISISSQYTQIETPINTTVVADASNYYGVAKLDVDILPGDMQLKVDSIFQSIVPSAQSSTPITDFGIGTMTSTILELESANISRSVSWTFSPNGSLIIGQPVSPGTFSFMGLYTDDSRGNVVNSSGEAIGSINYITGDISLGGNSPSSSYSGLLTYTAAAVQEQVSESGSIGVVLLNRGFSYVYNCYPNPVPGTLRVDFRAGGKWYSLYDQGDGHLVGVDESLGSGTVNFITGTVALSLGYMPDIDSSIFFFWGKDTSVVLLPEMDFPCEYSFDLGVEGLIRNSITLEWSQNGVDYSVSDNGLGRLIESEGSVDVGAIKYGSSRIEFTPHVTPPPSTQLTVSYVAGEVLTDSPTVTPSGTAYEKEFTLPVGDIVPFSIYFEVTIKSDPIETGIVNSWSNSSTRNYWSGSSYVGNFGQRYSSRDKYTRADSASHSDTVSIGFETAWMFKDGRFEKKYRIADDGEGNLYELFKDEVIGSIDYATGHIVFNANEYLEFEKNIKTIESRRSSRGLSGVDHATGTSNEATYTNTETDEALLYPQADAFDLFTVKYLSLDAGDAGEKIITLDREYKIDSGNLLPLLPGSCVFQYDGKTLIDNKQGQVGVMGDTSFTPYGDINYSQKTVNITKIDSYSDTANLNLLLKGGALSSKDIFVSGLSFRTPGIPLTPGSLTFRITSESGETLTATAAINGNIIGSGILGFVDQENGTVNISFGEEMENSEANQAEDWYDEGLVYDDDPTKVWKPIWVNPSSAIISCVVYSYMPLDPDLIGMDPVRLPIDGKVPVFKDGYIILIHNTKQYTCPDNLTAGQSFNIGRTGTASIELFDSDGVYVPETDNYEIELSTGNVTMLETMDLSSYTQPLVALSRVEDMMLASDVQVTGHISVTRPITGAYGAEDTYVSSILPIGDMQSRVYNQFVQKSWTNVWSNIRIGDGILSQYDDVNYPIEVVNQNATQERWALIFESSTTVKIVGEHLGVIATGVTILNDIAYPANGNPYFTIRKEGWGTGWSSGNVMRFNTNAANFPVYFCRATLQGPATESSDQFQVIIRGDSS